jgi:hypothetical protein
MQINKICPKADGVKWKHKIKGGPVPGVSKIERLDINGRDIKKLKKKYDVSYSRLAEMLHTSRWTLIRRMKERKGPGSAPSPYV